MKLWRPRPTPPEATARRTVTGPDRKRAIEESIPIPVEIAGQWAWRVLLIFAVLVAFCWLIVSVREIVIPFLIAILISALLVPFRNFLVRNHWPRWLAVLVSLILAVGIIAGLVFITVVQVRDGLPAIEKQTVAAYANFKTFLAAPPFNISKAQYAQYFDDIVKAIQSNNGAIFTSAGVVGSTALKLGSGLLLTIFATVFLVLDGGRVWAWFVGIFPRRARPAVDGAGLAGWITLTSFIRVQLFVAAVDGVAIGLGAFILGLPLAVPIGIIVFLGSFVPVVGAVVTGALAVFIALVYEGPWQALIMLGIVLLVHVIEGNFLHPFVTGNAVKVHPLAIVFAVAAGSFVAGIPGALFAVPLVAVVNVMVLYIARGGWRTVPGPGIPSRDVVKSDE
ncbi:MAG TPA: AI-2E family transporter [Galbitalea sp.]